MKTNPLRHILIVALGTTIVLGLLFYIRNSLKSSIATPKEGIPNPLPLADFARDSNSYTHVAESDRLSTVSNVQQQVTSVTNGPGFATAPPKSKSATSPSGEHAEISPDGRRVTLTDKSGHVIWSKDIVVTFGTNLPMYFTGEISSPEFYSKGLLLRAGNEYIEVDGQKTGEIISRDAR